jgi:hypothetical protein
LKIREKIFAPDHPSVATSLFNLANAYDSINDHRKVLEYAERSYEIRRKIYKTDDELPEFARQFEIMGVAYNHLEQNGKAMEFWKRSYNCYKKLNLHNCASSISYLLRFGKIFSLSFSLEHFD